MWDRSRPHDRRESLFGGRGIVRVWNLWDIEPTRPFRAILACELEAASSVGPHQQLEFAEALIVIEGQGQAHVGDMAVSLWPGAAAHIPLGQILQLKNTSPDRPLRYLIVKVG